MERRLIAYSKNGGRGGSGGDVDTIILDRPFCVTSVGGKIAYDENIEEMEKMSRNRAYIDE